MEKHLFLKGNLEPDLNVSMENTSTDVVENISFKTQIKKHILAVFVFLLIKIYYVLYSFQI